MRLILRIMGTWLLVLALILLVIDGTRMLAAGAWTFTTLMDNWAQFFPEGPDALRQAVHTYVHPLLWDPTITTLLAWPGWAVLGALGILLAVLGRVRRRRAYIEQDQF
jgi:hypothetical protein